MDKPDGRSSWSYEVERRLVNFDCFLYQRVFKLHSTRNKNYPAHSVLPFSLHSLIDKFITLSREVRYSFHGEAMCFDFELSDGSTTLSPTAAPTHATSTTTSGRKKKSKVIGDVPLGDQFFVRTCGECLFQECGMENLDSVVSLSLRCVLRGCYC